MSSEPVRPWLIRERLFRFSEVLDVLATSREDTLVVVFVRRPRRAEW